MGDEISWEVHAEEDLYVTVDVQDGVFEGA